MLRTFAVALLATALIGGAAVAAESGNTGAAAPAQAAQINPAKPAIQKQVHKNFARTAHRTKVAHHLKGKAQKHRVVHVYKGGKHAKRGSVKTAKLPASRTN